MRAIKKSALLKTSVATDVQRSGGVVSITGLPAIRYNEIRSVKQIKYRAEVVQVVTVGSTSYTPTANTRYAIEIQDPEARREGFTGVSRTFGYTTPPVLTTIGATAALQREYIHDKIVTAINLATAYVNVTAATLGTGTGFTLTDSTGYYPANPNSGTSRKGANNIIAKTNTDATGFTSADVTISTAAVYEFGNGTTLASNAPVIASYTQLLVSGDLAAPVATDNTYATAGQKYDAFIISSLGTAAAHAVSDQIALVPQEFAVFVDNGTGTATTNLTGFGAFEKEMHRLIGSLYENEPNAIVEFFDTIGTFSGSATPAPLGTDASVNQINTGKNVFQYFVKASGGSIILAPYTTTTGLPIVLDATDDEGMELSAPVGSNSVIGEFTVGKQEFSLFAPINIDDVSGTDAFYCGFRKKEAHQAVPDNYDEMAAFALDANAGALKIATILNNAATVATSTGITWADTNTKQLEIRVKIDGSVKFLVDGVDKTSVQSTAFEFDAGEVVIPFVAHLNTSDLATPKVQRMLVLPTANWRG